MKLILPAMYANQVNKTAASQAFSIQRVIFFGDLYQFLAIFISYRNNYSSIVCQLFHKWELVKSPFDFCDRGSCKTYTNAKPKGPDIKLRGAASPNSLIIKCYHKKSQMWSKCGQKCGQVCR